MIKLFNYKENNFNSNGIATIKPLTLMEYKETSLNGWHIETEIPIKYNDLIKEGMIALVETKSKGAQPFLISNITKTTKTLHFVAKHYVFDSINYVLEDVRPTNMSAAGALKYINDRTDIKSPFTTNSNVSATNTAYFINKNMLEALDTIQERWGGVYDVDKFHINLKNKVGIDRGDTIMYGKNLEGLKVFEDWSNVVTKLLPVGFDGITLPETFLYSEIDYGKPYTKVVRFETELEDEERTEAALIQELRANALEYLKENEVPKLSYEVESNINQRLGIGDTIHVKHPVVDILTEVIAYEYNVLTKRVTKITFGNYKRSVKKKVDAIKDSIKEVAEKTNDFETIINDQTNIINDMNKKGHVYIDDNQIMVLDKIPKETAKHVWRWNMGGLGYSENGVEGPFKQAWTIDGVFNTDFISAGSIMTNHLSSDVGSSLDLSSNKAINLISQELDNQGNQLANAEVRLDGVAGNVTINANNIRNKIDKGKAAADINSGTVAINANKIKLEGYTTINGNFRVDTLGNMAARNATVEGEVVAKSGNIGGFTVYNDRLASISKSHDFRIVLGGDSQQGDRWPIWAGKQSSNEPFFVLRPDKTLFHDGELHAGSNWRLNGRLNMKAGSYTREVIIPLTNNQVRGKFNELLPSGSNTLIGASSDRWDGIYLRTHPNVSSDLRYKYAIQDIPKGLIEEISKVEPKMYLQNKIWHFGYIAQDIERALYKWATREFGSDAKHYVDKFAFLHKDESYMSLLYGEIAVLKEKAMNDRINKLKNELEKLKEVLIKGEYK